MKTKNDNFVLKVIYIILLLRTWITFCTKVSGGDPFSVLLLIGMTYEYMTLIINVNKRIFVMDVDLQNRFSDLH